MAHQGKVPTETLGEADPTKASTGTAEWNLYYRFVNPDILRSFVLTIEIWKKWVFMKTRNKDILGHGTSEKGHKSGLTW